MIPLLVLLTIVVFLTLDYFVFRPRRGRVPPLVAPAEMQRLPPGLFVTPGHTWLAVDPGGGVTVGPDHLPGALLDHVDSVDLQAAGRDVSPGDPLATLRHDHRSLELRSPVAGRIESVNENLARDPGCLRSDPFGRGWLMRIAPRNLAAALRQSVIAEEAEQWTRGELERLRRWLTDSAVSTGEPAGTLPDGGVPVVGLVDRLDEPAWRELVHQFFGGPPSSVPPPEERWDGEYRSRS